MLCIYVAIGQKASSIARVAEDLKKHGAMSLSLIHILSMATEFSREFFSENRIVKADLRAAHQLREEDIARIKAEVKKPVSYTHLLAEEIKNASPSQPPIGGSSPEGGAPGVPVTSTVNE